MGTITGTVEVFISGVAPVAEDDAITTNEDVSITFDVLSNDSDPAGTSLSIASVSQPEDGAVVVLSTNGTLTYTPNNNFNGTDRFSYTVINEEGSVAAAEVVITVIPINDPPVFASTPLVTGATGELYEYQVQVIDVDGPNVTITGDTVPGWLALTDNGNGEAVLVGTPAPEDTGDHLVALRCSDGFAEQVQSFLITVVEGAPPVPMLMAPENGADSVRVPVTFTWTSVGATAWDIQISLNEQFANIVINASNLSVPLFQENELSQSTSYFWRVRARNAIGTSDWSPVSSFRTNDAVNVGNEDAIPQQEFMLHPPYPNPSSGVSWIEVDTESVSGEPLTIAIYDLRGRRIATLFEGVPYTGNSRYSWDGTNEWGQSVASGTYFVRLTHKNQQQIQSLVLLR